MGTIGMLRFAQHDRQSLSTDWGLCGRVDFSSLHIWRREAAMGLSPGKPLATYRAWLDEAPIRVQQKLMRHAHISTTMDQYGNASLEAKLKANRPVVRRVL